MIHVLAMGLNCSLWSVGEFSKHNVGETEMTNGFLDLKFVSCVVPGSVGAARPAGRVVVAGPLHRQRA